MPERERDDETGRFTGSGVYTDEDFLKIIREEDGAAGTRTVADAIGCHRDTALRRLKSMEGDKVERKDVGDAALWLIKNDE